jgi:hypothetical protein
LIVRIAIFDCDVLPLNEARFLQAPAERDNKILEWRRRPAAKKTDYRPRRLLRSRGKRPCNNSVA